MHSNLLLRSAPLLLALFIVGCSKEQSSDLPLAANATRPAAAQAELRNSQIVQAEQALKSGDTKAARQIAEQILVESPSEPAALEITAKVAAVEERFLEAASLARTLAETNKSSPNWLLQSFDWHFRGGDFIAAEADLRLAIELQRIRVRRKRFYSF